MPDAVDMASQIEAEHLEAGLRRTLVPLDPGTSGECDDCGEIMPRLIGGRCGFCRDGRSPPPDWTPPVIPAASTEEPATMRDKTINLPSRFATAIAAVEARAEEQNITLGHAAAELIEAGAARQVTVALKLDTAPIADLIAEMQRRIEGAVDQTAFDAALDRARQAEEARDAANERLNRLREALA